MKLLSLLITIAVFAGCGKKSNDSSPPQSEDSSAKQSNSPAGTWNMSSAIDGFILELADGRYQTTLYNVVSPNHFQLQIAKGTYTNDGETFTLTLEESTCPISSTAPQLWRYEKQNGGMLIQKDGATLSLGKVTGDGKVPPNVFFEEICFPSEPPQDKIAQD